MHLAQSLLLALLFLLPVQVSFAAPVDINTADAATLSRELKGIGETRARAIVEHRRLNGPFRSVDELALVKGIGARVIELNRPNLRVGRVPQQAIRSAPAAGPAPVVRNPGGAPRR